MKRLQLDSIVFLMVIFIFGIANIVIINKPKVSELENRALKQKPQFTVSALLNGSYFSDYDEYYSDTFVLRDKLLKLSGNIRQTLLLSSSGPKLVVSGKSKEVNTASDSKAVNTSEGNQELASKETPAKKQFNEGDDVGYWLVIDGKAVELFRFNKDNFDYYAEVLNKYDSKLGNKIPIYSLIAPTASEFVQLNKYKGITDSQNNAVEYLNSKLGTGITAVNTYDILNEHKNEYIYFRSDHHWTALGAYYGYSAFMQSKNEEAVGLEKYKTVKIDNFLGSSYSKTMDKSIEKNPDTIHAYIPFTNYKYDMYHYYKRDEAEIIDMKYAKTKKDKYLVFLSSGDATWAVIKTDVKNGKKLLVIKDSYGNCLVPFLLPHYEEIYVVDPRFYDFDTIGKDAIGFIGSKGINEILFVNYMENVNSKEFMQSVESLIKDK
jgi:hypothetical protein